MRDAMSGSFGDVEELLGASTKFSSSCSPLAEGAVAVVVAGGKLKRFVAREDAL